MSEEPSGAGETTGSLARLIQRALAHVRARSAGAALPAGMALTINFHPDWPDRGRSVIERLAEDGIYRSQFETGTSNGGLTAWPGGNRWQWESRIFGGAYDDAPAASRPKYGALNPWRWSIGGAPRFGSAHLRLRPHVRARTSFCYPDSHWAPEHFGTAERMDLLARLEADRGLRDPLDLYVEAHSHGPLDLSADVEALVLDPSHKGTEVESFARVLPCPVEWHPGFRLPGNGLADCAAYRGAEAAALAARLAGRGALTPRRLGRAAGDGRVDREILKRAWHCLARFGSPDIREAP